MVIFFSLKPQDFSINRWDSSFACHRLKKSSELHHFLPAPSSSPYWFPHQWKDPESPVLTNYWLLAFVSDSRGMKLLPFKFGCCFCGWLWECHIAIVLMIVSCEIISSKKSCWTYAGLRASAFGMHLWLVPLIRVLSACVMCDFSLDWGLSLFVHGLC